MEPVIKALKAKNITVKLDDDDSRRSGWKFNEYEMKGVPVRIAVGPRDLENNQVEIARRDTLEKQTISFENLDQYIGATILGNGLVTLILDVGALL